jgi:hypothetical protein
MFVLGEKLGAFTSTSRLNAAQASKVTPPVEILAALDEIPELELRRDYVATMHDYVGLYCACMNM